MGRRSSQRFLIELAILGALAAGIFVEKQADGFGPYVIVPALAILIPLYFWNYVKPYGRRRQQQRRSNVLKFNPPTKQWPAWQVYALASLLTVATFCLVFFWPSGWFMSGSQASQASIAPTANQFSCRVKSITDGDTLRCWDGTRVRLHAVAAREKDETCSPGHPCPSATGAAATLKLAELASGQTLTCEPTGTTYNRIAAICRNEQNVEINCAMVKSGTALVWPRYNEERAICGTWQ